MKNLENEIFGLDIKNLSSQELTQLAGGRSIFGDIAYGIAYVAGKTTHAVLDTVLILTGNYEVH
jgi:hypothetical protein